RDDRGAPPGAIDAVVGGLERPSTLVGANDGSTDPSVLVSARLPAWVRGQGRPVAERGAEPDGGAELVEATAQPAINVVALRSSPGGRARPGSDITPATIPKSP